MNIKVTNDGKEDIDSFQAGFTIHESDGMREILCVVSAHGSTEDEARSALAASVKELLIQLNPEPPA